MLSVAEAEATETEPTPMDGEEVPDRRFGRGGARVRGMAAARQVTKTFDQI